jgi:hypothetical protein
MYIPGSRSINCTENKTSSFINLSSYLKKQMNHGHASVELKLQNCAATQLWEVWLAQLCLSYLVSHELNCNRVAVSPVCADRSFWKFRFRCGCVSLVCYRPYILTYCLGMEFPTGVRLIRSITCSLCYWNWHFRYFPELHPSDG